MIAAWSRESQRKRKVRVRSLYVFLNLALTGALFVNLPVTAAQPQATNAGTTSKRVFQLGDNGGAIEYPQGWTPNNYANLHELWNVTPERLANLQPSERETVARIETTVIPCADHAEAVHRLREIEAEWGMTSRFMTIGGWPALQRRLLVPKPRVSVRTSAAPDSIERLFMVTTAVAAGKMLVRLDGFAPETVSPEVLDQIESMGRALRPRAAGDPAAASHEVEQLQTSPSLRMPQAGTSAAPRGLLAAAAGGPVDIAAVGAATNLGAFDLQLGSESEIAVSPNGTNIVVARQCVYTNSTDGGLTFSIPPQPPNDNNNPGTCTGGDSSVAIGRSGNFYWSTIGSNTATCPLVPPPDPPAPPATPSNCNNIQQMARSTDNTGMTFTNVATVIDCRVTNNCGFAEKVPDQEHIAADRVNASGSGGDQVYLVFRRAPGYGIQCSTDSGVNWTTVVYYTGGSIDFPRITVAQNGTVFVVTDNGNNINLDSFSSCANGLVRNLMQVAIATGVNPVVCPVAGLDRCNAGNTLRSHTLAVDDTNANHLYVAYATNNVPPAPLPPGPAPTPLTTLGNENVLVRDSIDGGSTWRPAVQVNQSVNGRRYEPWVCATGGTAVVSWLDRRASTTAANDLTDYFGGTAFLSGGNLTAGTDFQIDGAADPECASGWPCLTPTLNPENSESCNTQPQLAGLCRHTPNNKPVMDSKMPCDFSGADATVCPAMETCQGDRGCPKYGDYTANACVLGRLLAAWPSATNQPGGTPLGKIVSFFASTVVGPTPTTTKYTGATTADFHDSAALSATLVLGGTSIPVAGQLITFTLGSQNCAGTTNASGFASCSLALNQAAGPYTVTAGFAGSGNFQASNSGAQPFTITKEETTLSYTGPTLIANGSIVSAVLKEDGAVAIAGRLVTFTLGTGETCSGTTDATGKATCPMPVLNTGPGTITATFAGDAFYLPSSANATVITVIDIAAGLINPLFAGTPGSCPMAWVCAGSPDPGFASYAPGVAQYPGGSPFATSAFSPTVFGGSGTIRQNTSLSWIGGKLYYLDLWKGLPKTEPDGTTQVSGWPLTVRLYLTTAAGEQVLALDIGAPAPNVFASNPIFFTLPANSPFLGKKIGVLIFVSGPNFFSANFDITPLP
jgi:hypothetical protein